MSGTSQEVSAQPLEPEEGLESLEYAPGPDLARDSGGAGYLSFQETESNEGMFSRPQTDLGYFDSVSDDNILLSESESAKLLEHYFGQLSLDDELDDFLDYIDSAVLEPEEVDEMGGALVLELDLTGYDGRQHIHRHDGEVSREVVEYLDEESSWSDHTYFMEDEGRLFIRSNP